MVLTCLSTKGQDVFAIDKSKRCVKPCGVHFGLLGDHNVCVHFEALTLGDVLMRLVERHSTEDVDVSIVGLYRRGSLWSAHF